MTNGVEAVFVHDGKQEKVVINDEGNSASTERIVIITADLPLSLALQYVENVNIENKFIALHQIESEVRKKMLNWN